MNKTNYLIFILILCFSIAFVVFPFKSFAYILENGGSGGTTTDTSSGDLEYGGSAGSGLTSVDTGTVVAPVTIGGTSESTIDYGQFGATQEATVNDTNQSNTYFETDPNLGGYYVNPSSTGGTSVPKPDDDDEDDEDNGTTTVVPSQPQYRCRQCRGTTCAIRYSNTSCPNTCRTNEDCGGAAMQYSCNQCRGTTCSVRYSVTPCISTCRSNRDCGGTNGIIPPPPVSPPPVSPPPTSPPPTLPETIPCMINYFELPKIAFVNQVIKGRWSASYWCEDCDVDCEPYPECVWKQESIGIGEIGQNEYRFRIQQTGIYDYFLTCWGPGGIDEKQKTAQIEILNLPWWREIVPVLPSELQGFLRGIWR